MVKPVDEFAGPSRGSIDVLPPRPLGSGSAAQKKSEEKTLQKEYQYLVSYFDHSLNSTILHAGSCFQSLEQDFWKNPIFNKKLIEDRIQDQLKKDPIVGTRVVCINTLTPNPNNPLLK